jgi:hypothetical protein
VAANRRLDPRHHLIRMAGFGYPVVRPKPKPPHTLSNRGALSAHDHAQVGQHPADSLYEVPSERAQQRGVDHERVEPQRGQFLSRDRA